MQRAITATLGAAVIALPTADAVAAIEKSATAAATPKKIVVTKTVSGPAVEADRWGAVTVTVKVRKTTVVVNGVKKATRKWFDIGGSFTYHTDRSLYIMQQALPHAPPAGTRVTQRERRHDLRRHLHERGVPAVAAGRARERKQGLNG